MPRAVASRRAEAAPAPWRGVDAVFPHEPSALPLEAGIQACSRFGQGAWTGVTALGRQPRSQHERLQPNLYLRAVPRAVQMIGCCCVEMLCKQRYV